MEECGILKFAYVPPTLLHLQKYMQYERRRNKGRNLGLERPLGPPVKDGSIKAFSVLIHP